MAQDSSSSRFIVLSPNPYDTGEFRGTPSGTWSDAPELNAEFSSIAEAEQTIRELRLACPEFVDATYAIVDVADGRVRNEAIYRPACAWCHGAHCSGNGAPWMDIPCPCDHHDGSRQDEYEHQCRECGQYVCCTHCIGDGGLCPSCVETFPIELGEIPPQVIVTDENLEEIRENIIALDQRAHVQAGDMLTVVRFWYDDDTIGTLTIWHNHGRAAIEFGGDSSWGDWDDNASQVVMDTQTEIYRLNSSEIVHLPR